MSSDAPVGGDGTAGAAASDHLEDGRASPPKFMSGQEFVSKVISPTATRPAGSKLARFMPTKVCVFGSGSFGTAMGTVLARNGCEVWLLTRRKEVEEMVTTEHKNPAAFPDMILPFNVTATTDVHKALDGCQYIVHAIPVQKSLEFLKDIKHAIPPHVPIINTSKGLHTELLMLMSDLIPHALEREQPFCVISGPTFAAELMRGYPSGAVCASKDRKLAEQVALLFTSSTMRVWTSTDIIGTEVAGALKNVYAIASGALEGLGLGLNTTAMLCTRAIAEMNRLTRALGGHDATLAGLSGVGDMVLTCFGKLSRNRTVGVRLGKGETLESIQSTMSEVAEGVATAPAALKLAHKHHVAVPIIEAVVAVLQGKLSSPLPALMALLSLPVGDEAELLAEEKADTGDE